MALPFRAATVRASVTPPPDSPYLAAARVWDDRIGSARAQAQNWRLVAILVAVVAIVLAIALLALQSRSTIAPYIVTVDERGIPLEVAKAQQPYNPTDAQIANALLTFVQNVRSLSTDPVVVRENWLRAYQFLSDHGAVQMNEWAQKTNPLKAVESHEGISVMVEVVSIVKAAGNTFQVRWTETTYRNGAKDAQQTWVGAFALVFQQPRTVERLRVNPLGIYVDGFNWTQESIRNDTKGQTK